MDVARPLPRVPPLGEGNHAMKLSYSLIEAAELVGCSPAMLRKAIKSADLPAFTMSPGVNAKQFVRHDDLVAYIDYCRDRNAA